MKHDRDPKDPTSPSPPAVTRWLILGRVVEDRPRQPGEIFRIEQSPEVEKWRGSLRDRYAQILIAREILKLARGSGTAEHKREGLHELKVDYGPGYRLYYGKVGHCIVFIFAGGTKKNQQQEINDGVDRWKEIKRDAHKL